MRIRIYGFGPCATMTAPQVIQAHHKKTIGINGLARTDTGVPPTWTFVVFVVKARCVVMATKSMADQHCVVSAGIECAVGFVYQFKPG